MVVLVVLVAAVVWCLISAWGIYAGIICVEEVYAYAHTFQKCTYNHTHIYMHINILMCLYDVAIVCRTIDIHIMDRHGWEVGRWAGRQAGR